MSTSHLSRIAELRKELAAFGPYEIYHTSGCTFLTQHGHDNCQRCKQVRVIHALQDAERALIDHEMERYLAGEPEEPETPLGECQIPQPREETQGPLTSAEVVAELIVASGLGQTGGSHPLPPPFQRAARQFVGPDQVHH